MRILITGADGFLGRRVVNELLAAGRIGNGFEPFSTLVLMACRCAGWAKTRASCHHRQLR